MTVVKSSYVLQKNDLYQTPHWTTQCLIDRFPVNNRIVWEPAAGNHQMAETLLINGASVITSDIEHYKTRQDEIYDFMSDSLPITFDIAIVDWIITNPPYGTHNALATEFARRALRRCKGKIAMLMTAKWDFGKSRYDLTRNNRRFAAKINLCDRIRWFDGEREGTEDHAWYVWDRVDAQHDSPIILYAHKGS